MGKKNPSRKAVHNLSLSYLMLKVILFCININVSDYKVLSQSLIGDDAHRVACLPDCISKLQKILNLKTPKLRLLHKGLYHDRDVSYRGVMIILKRT